MSSGVVLAQGDAERAAPALTETLTRLADKEEPVRLNVATRQVVGAQSW